MYVVLRAKLIRPNLVTQEMILFWLISECNEAKLLGILI
jgi:hypothetical protein